MLRCFLPQRQRRARRLRVDNRAVSVEHGGHQRKSGLVALNQEIGSDKDLPDERQIGRI